jgi:hypothetical protein
MSNENEIALSNNLPMTEYDVEATSERLRVLRKFVKSELKSGIDNDYAIVPGTKKYSLLKPGAQKLRLLFGLGVRVNLSSRTIDRANNMYIVTYKAQVFHIASGRVIAECEGTANNFEKKYHKRTSWVQGENGSNVKQEEETPIGDLLNTLDKMAQKRAVVGATIEALGASDYFTQDVDDEIEQEQAGLRPNTDQIKKNANEDGEVVYPNCETVGCESLGKKMMISKFADKQTGKYGFYCPKCKAKKS